VAFGSIVCAPRLCLALADPRGLGLRARARGVACGAMFRSLACSRGPCVRSRDRDRDGYSGMAPYPGHIETDRLIQWAHVGPGNGQFELNEKYGFVGRGIGSWEREVVTTYEGWRFRNECKVMLVVLVAAAIGVSIGACIRGYDMGRAFVGLREQIFSAFGSPGALQASSSDTSAKHDCADRLEDWEHAWSASKRDWCCRNVGRGCREGTTAAALGGDGFRCAVERSESWRDDELDWCCHHRGLGCSILKAKAEAAQQSKSPGHFDCSDVPPEGKEKWPAKKVVACLGNQDFKCDEGKPESWGFQQKAWCCEVHHVGCGGSHPSESSVPHVASQSRTAAASAADEEHYDCSRNLLHWVHDWSPQKKAWCCRNRRIGCPPVPSAARAANSRL